MKNYMNSEACIAGKYLCMRVKDEKFIRIIDLSGRKGREAIVARDLSGIQESDHVQEHQYRMIDIKGMLESVKDPNDPNNVSLKALR